MAIISPFSEISKSGDFTVNRAVVGPLNNNVYVIRCSSTGKGVLIDAADEAQYLKQFATTYGVTKVLETHGHHDHIQAVPELREAGIEVSLHPEDSSLLPTYDLELTDEEVVEVGKLKIQVIHTPGHTPGSTSFYLLGSDLLFTGDTLFPGGPGATHFPGGDFKTIINSIENRIFRVFPQHTVILPGHGRFTQISQEISQLDSWIQRGW